MEKEKVNKCCGTCACIVKNKDAKSPIEDFEWYSQKNIDRLWDAIKVQGAFLICHSTDPNAKTYGGSDKIKDGKKKACLGPVFYVFAHIKIFEFFNGNFKKYKDAVGHKVAMHREAMLSCALDMQIGRTGNMFGGGDIVIAQTMDHVVSDFIYPTGFEKTITLFKEISSKQVEV